MRRYRARVAYDGSRYHGFQRQAAQPTIQAALEEALSRITGQQVQVVGAGRTDAGVHADGQVIAFDCAWPHSDEDLLRAANAHLPPEIALQELCQQPGFHPRYDALARRYRYHVLETPVRQPLLLSSVWQVHRRLDLDAMQKASAVLVGQHDFAAFGRPPRGTNTVRIVFVSQWESQPQGAGRLLTYRIEATAFLQHMVRRIVAVLVNVGRGSISPEGFTELLRSADIAQARAVAPPQGLVLEAVRYRDAGK